ncbi:MAG: hypothetical protein H7Z13_07675 [Ferruginibacter sp.]|nr:hypothetical protein [Ferruginibacter sp.]
MKLYDKADLPKKVRLSGADCFHLVLDKHAKKHQAGGNVMRKIIYFNNALCPDTINTVLQSSLLIHWLCNIELVPGSLLTIPYWKYADKGNKITVREHQHGVADELPAGILSRDIPVNADVFIDCDIVHYPSGNCSLVISWNHILMDGKGNSLLIKHLDAVANGEESKIASFFPAREKKPNILRYIINMYQVKKFVQDSSKRPISSVADKAVKSASSTAYKTIHFNNEKTEKITGNAYTCGARFGNTIFYIACCAHVINKLNQQRGKNGVIWLPVPYDGRLRGATGPVISNCVAFLFYRIPQTALTGIRETVKCISDQMTNQIKNKRPQKYTLFLNMMRHLPLGIYYRFINYSSRGVFASFLYTSTGENFADLKHLFGQQVRDITILPALTFPPGLTFVFLKHNNGLNVNIAYSPDIVTKDELFDIEQKLQQLLLNNYS